MAKFLSEPESICSFFACRNRRSGRPLGARRSRLLHRSGTSVGANSMRHRKRNWPLIRRRLAFQLRWRDGLRSAKPLCKWQVTHWFAMLALLTLRPAGRIMFNPETDRSEDVSHTVALLRRLGIEGRSVPLALKDRHVGWDRQLTLRMAVHNSVRRHQSKRRHRNRHGQHEDHGSGIGHLPHDRHPSTRGNAPEISSRTSGEGNPGSL